MFSDRLFQIAFLVSLLAHAIILFYIPDFKITGSDKREERLEVNYVKDEIRPKEQSEKKEMKKEPIWDLPSRLEMKKKTPPPFINTDKIFLKDRREGPGEFAFNKPSLFKPDIIAIKKKITLPAVGIDNISNPSYLNYYQLVREKIRRAAYQNYTRAETGEVYLSFVILREGNLKESQLLEEKSSASTYLKDVALRSLQDASPFPAFFPKLDYSELSFNVVISFEVE